MKKYQAKLWSSERGEYTRCFDSLLAAKQWCGRNHWKIAADRAYILICPPLSVQQGGIDGYYDIISEKVYSGHNQHWEDALPKVCPKCGKSYLGHPAISRIDGSKICQDCGVQEALDAFSKAKTH